MHPYLYSARNVREVWYRETRKGVSPASKILRHQTVKDPLLVSLKRSFRRTAKLRRDLRKLRKSGAAVGLIDSQKKKIRASLKRRERLVKKFSRQIQDSVHSKSFGPTIVVAGTRGSKPAYDLGDPYAENWFLGKICQQALTEAFGVKATSRDAVMEQLISVVDDRMPKIVVRADVASFFESIPHDLLINRLRRNPKLSSHVRRTIKAVLSQYATITGQSPGAAVGVPRGVGISSTLAEAFMADLDEKYRGDADVVFYARYVDDLVVVFSDSGQQGIPTRVKDRFDELEKDIAELGLTLSADPEKRFSKFFAPKSAKPLQFSYLGYRLSYSNDPLKIRLSQSRSTKLISRMAAAFDAYVRSKSLEGKALRLLVSRMRLLTGNTRLHNNKRAAFVGIYYSNRFLNETDQLAQMDLFLKARALLIPSAAAQRKLALMSFEAGFKEKVFVRHKPKMLKQISSVWKVHG